ncbi:stearic acid desaturase [Novymonas esmeraldas]|uniref:Stearic acid desaturase n=1 Tax=Novymonas esmeraldas TaxID=1808958 RepID=A0AAW0EUP4_9TRYP
MFAFLTRLRPGRLYKRIFSFSAEAANKLPKEQREVPQWTKGNFEYNWIGIAVITVPLIFSVLGFALRIPAPLPVLQWGLLFYVLFGAGGITAGYHRLFSHGTYTAGQAMKWSCAYFGAASFQGSIKWWARNHRIHHRYTDTSKDPYDARRGFIFTHFGWFVMRMDYELLGRADVSDLDGDLVVDFQRKYYGFIAGAISVVIPMMLSAFTTGEWVASFFWATMFRIHMMHHSTFFINSLAHTNWFDATQPYADSTTAHDSFIFTVAAWGEGYHNFHHQFPGDYRNGHLWSHFDITKWYIRTLSFLGFCDSLQRVPRRVIERAAATQGVRMRVRELASDRAALQRLDLPVHAVYTWEDVQAEVKRGRKLVVIDDCVLDLEQPIALESAWDHPPAALSWLDAHPGGRALLLAYVGRDATVAFNGGVYGHTTCARSYFAELRVGVLKDALVTPVARATDVDGGRAATVLR